MDGDLDLPGGVGGSSVRLAAGALAVALLVVWVASRRRVAPLAPLVGGLDRLSGTLVAFDRWVLDALGGAVVSLVAALAWTADAVEAGAFGAPADAVARRVVRVAGAARPHVGGSLSRVFWSLVALVAVACAGHGLWPGR